MNLKEKIESWDGKSKQDIEAAYNLHSFNAGFLGHLIDYTAIDNTQKGATWLLKKSLENGQLLTESQLSTLIENLSILSHWESKLHVLQCLPFISLSASHKDSVYYFLKSTLDDKNKFVRAWSYNGFHILSSQFPEYAQETQQYLEMAMRDEAPSVKARVRAILK